MENGMQQRAETEKGVLDLLVERYAGLGRGKRRVADFIFRDPVRAAFMTAAELGEKSGASEATAIRLAADLGFAGFPQMQRALGQGLAREGFQELPGAGQEGEGTQTASLNAAEEEGSGAPSPGDDPGAMLRYTLLADAQRIRDTLTAVDPQAFALALELLDSARRIYVVGLRESGVLAKMMARSLRMIYDGVCLLDGGSENDLLEQVMRISGEDVIVAISFPRYSIRTVKVLEYASSRSAGIITLTDSVHSPVNLYASCSLQAVCGMGSFLESMTAPLSLINAIVCALAARHEDEVLRSMRTVERAAGEHQMLGNEEMDYFEGSIELRPFGPSQGGGA